MTPTKRLCLLFDCSKFCKTLTVATKFEYVVKLCSVTLPFENRHLVKYRLFFLQRMLKINYFFPDDYRHTTVMLSKTYVVSRCLKLLIKKLLVEIHKYHKY